MMTFYLSFSRLFMVLGEWKDCQKWARRVIVEGGHNALEGLVLQAHLQEIIACYELGESELLGKLKKEVFRVLGNTEGTRIERELIKWIVNHAGIVDNKGMRAKAESLLRDMEGDRSRKPSADRIIRAWLRAKLLQTTMDLLLCEERDASLAALEAL
jgi:hypothetical protein